MRVDRLLLALTFTGALWLGCGDDDPEPVRPPDAARIDANTGGGGDGGTQPTNDAGTGDGGTAPTADAGTGDGGTEPTGDAGTGGDASS